MFSLASSKQNFVTLSMLAAFVALPGTVEADDKEKKSRYDNLLGSVNALSMALSRDPKADSPDVKSAMAKVVARQKEAADLAAAGEYESARLILDEGYDLLAATLAKVKSGTGYSGPSGSAAAPSGGDAGRGVAGFDARMSTAKAMLEALKRQNQEKRAGKDTAIADIETRLRQAETVKGVDLAGAQGLLDDAYNSTKLALQSLQAPSTMKTGSAALEAADGGGGADATRTEVERVLKSSALLRDAVARNSKDQGLDHTAIVARIDALSAEARSSLGSDLARALRAAREANQTAKDALSKLR